MDKDLIEAFNLFFLPASLLFSALSLAPREGLKTGISAIGLVISAAWFFRIAVWHDLDWRDQTAGLAIAGIFLLASAVSLYVHGGKFLKGEDDQQGPGTRAGRNRQR